MEGKEKKTIENKKSERKGEDEEWKKWDRKMLKPMETEDDLRKAKINGKGKLVDEKAGKEREREGEEG